MENKNNFQEERFDSYLNKIIIFSSKRYFKKQMRIFDKERTIVDDDNYNVFVEKFTLDDALFDIDEISYNLELKDALKSLTDIEQSVIFLLFSEELTEEEAAEMLEIWSRSVSRIKIRAIKKLRKSLRGDKTDER